MNYELQIEGSSDTLTQVANDVPYGENVDKLLTAMWIIMRDYQGIGIAANQVGSLQRVIIINTNGFVSEIINPVITKYSDNIKLSTEGCLSVPKKQAKIRRPVMVIVEGFDKKWNPIKKKVRAIQAFCVQHEIDHLNGILI